MANNNNEDVNNSSDSNKDSGSDKSFVGKFVSGLISNTPLSKWFGKTSTVRRRDDTDDEEDICNVQPRIKRAKPSLEHNNYNTHVFESPVTVHNTENHVGNKVFFPEPVAGPSGITTRKLFTRRDTTTNTTTSLFENDDAVVANGSNESDSEEESTSGYSSAPKHVSNKETVVEDTPDTSKTEVASPRTRSLFTSTANRSLFADRTTSPQINTSLSSRRPAFNSSTFGSPSFVDRTLSTKRILSSPFYSGNTIYGGASAYSRLDKSSKEHKQSIRIKPVNQKQSTSRENVVLSKTARRILNTLEQYSTPISEAKKIPITPKRQGILSKYVGASPYMVKGSKKASNTELQVPDLLQMKEKERLQNSTETVRQIATKSSSTLNKQEYKLRSEEDNKPQRHTGKMKSSVCTVRRKDEPEESVSEVVLPKISLPITTLPKFDFVIPPPSKEPEKSTTTQKIDKPPEDQQVKSNFVFSEPVIIAENRKSINSVNCFKFSEPVSEKPGVMFKLPEKQVDCLKLKNNGENVIKPSGQLVEGSVMDVLGKQKKTSSSLLDKFKVGDKWECPTCLVRNDPDKTKCVACDEPKPQTESKDSGFGDQFKLSGDKWECGTCLVRNNNSDKNCVACGGAGSQKVEIKTPANSFGDKFKPASDTWECTACLVRNKNDVSKCVACETAKEGSKSQPLSIFGGQFKPLSDTWECPTCMIRNKNELIKCAACETAKPGQKLTSNITFKFDNKSADWECQTCWIKNKPELKKCAACETPKPEPKTSSGFGDAFKMKSDEWECTSCMVKNKSDVDTCVCCGVVKPGSKSKKLSEASDKKPVISFNFGVDKSTPGQFQFGIPAQKSEEKPSAAPTFVFEADSTKSVMPSSGFNFGVKNQEPAKSEAAASQTITPSAVPNPLLKPSEKLPEKAEPAPVGFKFGIDTSKLNKTSNSRAPIEVKSTTAVTATTTPITSSSGTAKPTFLFKPTTTAVNGDVNAGSNLFKPPEVKDVISTAPPAVATLKFEPKPVGNPQPVFKFSESPTSTKRSFVESNESSGISNGLGSSTNKLPAFGSFGVPDNKSVPSFGSGDKPAFASSGTLETKPTVFGTPESKTPAFGSSDKPVFGTPETKPVFGASENKPAFGSTEVKPFAFGSSGDGSAPKRFSFGPSDKPNQTGAAPMFAFGSGNNAAGFNVPSTVGPGFNVTPSVPSVPTGSGFNATPAGAGGFNFSVAPVPNTFNFGGAAVKNDSQPSFGAPTNPFGLAKNGTFNFGSSANNNNQKAVFTFGANQSTSQVPGFPATTQAAGFNFAGASASTSAAPAPAAAIPAPAPGGFNFSGTPATFNFTDGNAAAGQPQRKIRKALRRTQR